MIVILTFIAIKYSVASKTLQLHVDGLKVTDEESVILSIKETCDRPVQTGDCGSGWRSPSATNWQVAGVTLALSKGPWAGR